MHKIGSVYTIVFKNSRFDPKFPVTNNVSMQKLLCLTFLVSTKYMQLSHLPADVVIRQLTFSTFMRREE